MTDRVGQRLGNYRLTRLLGKGGFAEVYLGEHLRLGTHAAVKVLYTRLATPADVEAFEKEARTIAHLSHPRIVRVFDFDVQDDTPFLVMDYAPNGTIRKQYPKGVPLPFPTILNYVKQVADALQYAHDEHFIHRDIKPENLLIGRRQEIMLSDFGVATIAHHTSSQSTQAMAGAVPDMAPEQIQGKPRPASDQYALGIVVYEWLCGERPFGGTATEIAMQHLLEPPPSLVEKMPTISPDVEQVVMTALAKDPKERFASIQAFATALEQASRVDQPHSAILSQASTIPSQPFQPLTMTSPAMLLSEQTDMSSPVEGVQTPPAPLDQSRQVVSSSRLQNRSEPVIQGISRRAMLLGLGVAGLAVAGGSLTWLVSSQGKHPSGVSSQPPTVAPHASPSPAPTPLPLGTLLYTYRGHSNYVNAGVWSPDGRRIASGSQDRTVQVWDAADGGHPYTYRGHSDRVLAVAWSPNGKRIASGGGDIDSDTTVQVWDATDGGNVFTYRGHSNYVNVVAWSPNGKRIASGGGDKTVQVWDAANGGNVFTYRGHSDAVWWLAWSPDGTRIASGSVDTTVQVWQVV